MKRIKKYLSLFFLALLLFPVLEKTSHELEHLKEKHCAGKGLHYCPAENNCHVCDYVFSKANTPPTDYNHLNIVLVSNTNKHLGFVSNEITPILCTFPLRGPPTS
ncbi:MAG: hypothetical protein WCR21_06835 [Bacteroidota bacterium]